MRRLWTPRWLLVHAAAVILVVGFALLGWWQVTRAASGNVLSYGYAIEWPAFASFVVYVWVKEMRQAVRGAVATEAVGSEAVGSQAVGSQAVGSQAVGSQAVGSQAVGSQAVGSQAVGTQADGPVRRTRARNEAAYDDSGDAELASYNRYLAWLNTHPHASPSEYPG